MSSLFLNLFSQLVSELVEVVPLVEEAGCQVRHLKGLQSKDLKESLTLIYILFVLGSYKFTYEDSIPYKFRDPPIPLTIDILGRQGVITVNCLMI
jgi:hypothetical protein